jgi:gas vesicle protein
MLIQFDFFNKILSNYDIEDSIKNEINNFLDNNLLNENFFNNFKQFFSKAAEKTSNLSDKAESIIKDILQKSKNAFSLIKKIGEEIRTFFKYIISNVKEYIKKNIESIKNKIDELYKLKKDGIIKDFKTMKEVLEFYRKVFLLKLNNSLDKNLTNFFQKIKRY